MLAGSGLLAICLAGAETALNLKGNGKPNTHRTHIIVIHMMHPYEYRAPTDSVERGRGFHATQSPMTIMARRISSCAP